MSYSRVLLSKCAVLTALVALAPLASALAQSEPDFSLVPSRTQDEACDCYVGTDCTVGTDCVGYTYCHADQAVKTNDGICEKIERSDVWPELDRETAAIALANYFDAYLVAGKTLGGEPDPALVQRARAVPLSVQAHRDLQLYATDAMDLALGFDLTPAQPHLGAVLRKVPHFEHFGYPEAEELVAAIKEGTLEAMRTGDPERIGPPLRRFWAAHPGFHPLHNGRCYPHHENQYPYADAEACQISELTRRLRGLIDPGSAGREG